MRIATTILALLLLPLIGLSQFSITGSSPSDGATSVGTSTTVSITFSAPVDTTRPFDDNSSYVTNIDNITGQYWSTDSRTVNIVVVLQPDSVYFLGVFSAHPQGGGSLSAPYATHFTTASSFPPNLHSVSGTVSGGTTGVSPSYAIVGMTVNGLAGNNGPVFVGVSAADVNGDFTIPYVPEGTWYPIAAKDVNGDGDIDPSTGDVVAQSDAVVVSGGNVTGISIVFQSYASASFGDARDSILAYAQNNLPANRELRRVDSWNADSVGRASEWQFYYTTPGNSAVTAIRFEPFGLSSQTQTGMWDYLFYSKPIPNVAAAALADSFVAHVENQGGREFRYQAPAGDTVVFRAHLNLGDLNWSQFYQMIPDTNQFYWGAQYSYDRRITSDSSYSLQSKLFLGDFATGNIIAVTGVDEKLPQAPVAFALEQNYPNPFNPTTNIGFRLPAGQAGIADFGLVRLAVYDLLGREVAVLVNEKKAPGTYTVQFDGSGLTSGVYFYRLQAGGFVQTRKLLLLR
ncbi:MAG: T9SS type A sorting domain-containing protein [Ignavibacteria bacterium]|nr:T9SS type A sorting domain-containing protein [Ignavibacteria bacterium]